MFCYHKLLHYLYYIVLVFDMQYIHLHFDCSMAIPNVLLSVPYASTNGPYLDNAMSPFSSNIYD